MANRYTDAAKHVALKRELVLRRKVYPSRVQTGRMSIQEAQYQINIMAEIAEHYRVLAEAEIAAGELPFEHPRETRAWQEEGGS